MSHRKDFSGMKQGRLEAIRFIETIKGRAFWLFRCDCGVEKVINPNNVFGNGDKKSQSCGCLNIERNISSNTTHGLSRTRMYRTWRGMLDRCSRIKNKRYHRYGGRGITVCEEWNTFINFRDWALSSGYSDELTIERINPDGNYEPSNCEWITKSENSKRARNYK